MDDAKALEDDVEDTTAANTGEADSDDDEDDPPSLIEDSDSDSDSGRNTRPRKMQEQRNTQLEEGRVLEGCTHVYSAVGNVHLYERVVFFGSGKWFEAPILRPLGETVG
jgi:hypothetical protein